MTGFFMAWSMFLAIPCPVKKWDDAKRPQMLAALPFVGLVAGAVWLAVYKLCNVLSLKVIGLALTAAAPWIVTGFMHLDGFLDCADAVLSFRDRERRIEILKDSHVGSFAVICMSILAIFTFAAWVQTGYRANLFVLLFIPAVSRAMAAACVLGFKPLGTSSYKKMSEEKRSKGPIVFCIMTAVVFCAAAVLLAGLQGIAVLVSAVCTLLTVLRIRANLGGMSGDISGCAITTGEAFALIALSITASV